MTNLTTLEIAVLAEIDNSEYGEWLCDLVWFWAEDMARSIGISAKAVGGVVTSLQEKGLVKVYIASARERRMGDESTIGMTEAGIEAYIAAVGGKSRKMRSYEEWKVKEEAAKDAPVTTAQEDFVAAILAD